MKGKVKGYDENDIRKCLFSKYYFRNHTRKDKIDITYSMNAEDVNEMFQSETVK
jgi:hypothetical protein